MYQCIRTRFSHMTLNNPMCGPHNRQWALLYGGQKEPSKVSVKPNTSKEVIADILSMCQDSTWTRNVHILFRGQAMSLQNMLYNLKSHRCSLLWTWAKSFPSSKSKLTSLNPETLVIYRVCVFFWIFFGLTFTGSLITIFCREINILLLWIQKWPQVIIFFDTVYPRK